MTTKADLRAQIRDLLEEREELLTEIRRLRMGRHRAGRALRIERAEAEGPWVDSQGDVWTLGDDGLLHTPETRPFPREHVEKKWGPLAPRGVGRRRLARGADRTRRRTRGE